MEELRRLFEEMGFSSVSTYIASGNVIFEAPETERGSMERRIESELEASLGYAVATFLRTPAELEAIAAREAEIPGPRHALYVAFLPGEPDAAALERLMAFETEDDRFYASGQEVYWASLKRVSESAFSGSQLEKALGMRATTRNMNTVRKLAARLGAGR